MQGPELISLVERVILDDASQRVDKILVGMRRFSDPVVDRTDFPAGGVVDHPDMVPTFGKTMHSGSRPYSFEYGGQTYWLNVPGPQGLDREAPWLAMHFCTYRPTPYLRFILWKEYLKDPLGPHVPDGFTLETLGNRRQDHRKLLDAACTCVYKYFKAVGDTVGIERAYSDGFIHKFSLPGEEEVVFSTLDDQIGFLRSLPSTSDTDLPVVSGDDNEVADFLSSLKSRCLDIRDKSGPSHSRAAFEIYKAVAKYLTA